MPSGLYALDAADTKDAGGDGDGIGQGSQILLNQAGNTITGIEISAGNSTIRGNYVGTDASGNVSVPNGRGVDVAANGNTIGTMRVAWSKCTREVPGARMTSGARATNSAAYFA